MKPNFLKPRQPLDPLLEAARQAWLRKDGEQAVDLLKKASRMAPGNAGILLQLGYMHGMRYDYASATACFTRAVRLSARKSETLALIARQALEFARPEIAEHYFQLALEHPDASPDLCVRLGELYERQHRLDASMELAERALRRDARCSTALLLKARLHRQARRLTDAENLVRPLLESPDRETRIRAGYQLAADLDRQNRWDEAMDLLRDAKAQLEPEAAVLRPQAEEVRRKRLEIQSHSSREMFKRWADAAADTVGQGPRVVFLAGYPRSGTTLLQEVLDAHPDIVTAEETSIFQADACSRLARGFAPGHPMISVLEDSTASALSDSRHRYLELMKRYLGGPIEGRTLIDKNPDLTTLVPAFVRVFPETRLLMAIRDPRDVVLSCYLQAHLPLTRGSAAYLTLEDAAEDYVQVMTVWKTLAPMLYNPYLEIRYRDVVGDLEQSSRKVVDFLGLDWNADLLQFNEHSRTKLVRSPTYADVRQPVYTRSVGRWRRYRKYLEPVLPKLQPFVDAFGFPQ
ncbi:MAG: sulfotransferase [Verrucomicrobiota bacterium]